MFVEQIRGYEILIEIGLGGMSRVYLAYDSHNRRHVAIKMLPSEYLNDLGYRSRFEQEAQLIATLEHEAIVPVYEYGVESSQPYIVMQYMPGDSLSNRLLRGSLSPAQTGSVLARIASALDYAHSKGIIHRDLKTSNILFDQDDNAYLADFGVALHAESTWQRFLASGTPAYMSPEQALRKEAVDARSDIYSLGIIIFETLTGELPFDGDMHVSVFHKHIYDPPPSLGAIKPDLPATLDPVLYCALAKNPQERYPSATEFLVAYQQALRQAENTSEVIEIHKQDVSVQEPQKIVSNPYERMPLAETTQPVIQLHKPSFPKFVIPTDKNSSHFRSIRRELGYIFTLGLVTWLAVLFAAFTAVVARSQELFPSSTAQIIYDESAIALVNFSNTPIDLSNVTFQRLTDQGTIVAAFSAEEWGWVNPETLNVLPAGDCVQLLRPEFNKFSITPGAAPAKPSSCDVSQGWLVATNDAWLFWIPGGEGELFQVVQNGQVVRTCRITDGSCEFFLPAQE
jgi:serine/threonine protein kinase